MTRHFLTFLVLAGCAAPDPPPPEHAPFALADVPAFADGRTLTNAAADFDNDGDLDLFVGFNGRPNRLYRNDGDSWTDVAPQVGIADSNVTRSAAWGDYDRDGDPDLFVAFVSRDLSSSRLYRNDGAAFVDVSAAAGIELEGSFRQVAWIDQDADGDLDLFIGFRDRANALMRNEDGRFRDVAADLGLDDERRTVGAAWFDYDLDGDLDLVVANMDGDANALLRKDDDGYTDVAQEAGLADGGRALGEASNGTVRPTIVDYNNDGLFDVFMANYGPNGLFRNRGDGTFENASHAAGVAVDGRYDAGAFGDYDRDGWEDLYVNGTITGGVSYPDHLFTGTGDGFVEVTPDVLGDLEADHGVLWADFDLDGRLDLALTGAAETGMHHVAINRTTGGHGISVLPLRADGTYAPAGSEVRVWTPLGRLLGARMVDSGSGYNSQNAAPVFVGLAQDGPINVEITVFTPTGRSSVEVRDIDPSEFRGRWLGVRIPDA